MNNNEVIDESTNNQLIDEKLVNEQKSLRSVLDLELLHREISNFPDWESTKRAHCDASKKLGYTIVTKSSEARRAILICKIKTCPFKLTFGCPCLDQKCWHLTNSSAFKHNCNSVLTPKNVIISVKEIPSNVQDFILSLEGYSFVFAKTLYTLCILLIHLFKLELACGIVETY